MDPLIGTRQCPHLGYDQQSIPCCHADDMTRDQCGKGVLNPRAQKLSLRDANLKGIALCYCSVLGENQLPEEAVRAAKLNKSKETVAKRKVDGGKGFRAPGNVTGRMEPKPERESMPGDEPVIPTHTLRNESRKIRPNEPCPCGSGRKYKKCCGR